MTYIIIHIVSGILGCQLYNKTIKYDSKSTKIVWNTLVFLNGTLGLLMACLTWLSKKICD
jgi:hypothetical protein